MDLADIKFSARMVVGRAINVTDALIEKRGELFQMDNECSDADRELFEAEMLAEAKRVHKLTNL